MWDCLKYDMSVLIMIYLPLTANMNDMLRTRDSWIWLFNLREIIWDDTNNAMSVIVVIYLPLKYEHIQHFVQNGFHEFRIYTQGKIYGIVSNMTCQSNMNDMSLNTGDFVNIS